MGFSNTSQASSTSAGAASAAAERSEWYLCGLRELADLALKLARCEALAALPEAEPVAAATGAAEAAPTPAPATEPPGPAPLGRDRSLAFGRYARVFQQSALVTAKVEAERKRGAAAGRGDRGRGRGDGKTARRKKEVKRLIESSLVVEGGEDAREDAVREALERLERMEFADDDDRPVGHIVEEICNAMGVGFDGRQWTDEELGLGWPGWPDEFAEFRDAGPPPMPPRSGSDGAAGESNSRTSGEAGTAAQTEAPKEGNAARKPASFWGDDPPPFSLNDQISRDCGLVGKDGRAKPEIDPCPD